MLKNTIMLLFFFCSFRLSVICLKKMLRGRKMNKLQIRNNYISVAQGQRRSFGGSQMLSASQTMREVGCGVIAALDLLLYLCLRTRLLYA